MVTEVVSGANEALGGIRPGASLLDANRVPVDSAEELASVLGRDAVGILADGRLVHMGGRGWPWVQGGADERRSGLWR